ncbi:MAG: hypothetical protein ACRDNI_00715 [Gaiellaceae bacterium]
MRRARFLLPLLVLGGVYWIWDSTQHDHDEPHGTPIGVAQVEQFARGRYVGSSGEPNIATSVDCRPGEDGEGEEPNVHFRCEIGFIDGDSLDRLVHVLEGDQLILRE